MAAAAPPTLTGTDGVSATSRKIQSSPLLFCFSHLRWNFVWQRPQHLLSRAGLHYRVMFFEEPLFEKVETAALRETQSGTVTVLTPILPVGLDEAKVTAALRALLDQRVASDPSPERLFWYYTPMALTFSRHIVPDLCVYDNMDELSAFRGAPPDLLALEAEMFRRADLVFTGGHSLYESKKARHPDIHAFPSAVDTKHFAQARRQRRDPADQAAIARPRLGFFGVIDERMDIELVDEVARLRPDWQLVMLGPVAKVDPASLPRRPNIHWLGGKSYDELPAYLSGWDLGFMPFALNEATRFISPTKTPEFLAAGVPVVSTPIRDVVRPYGERRLVAIAANAGEAIAACERILAEGQNRGWLRRVDRHLESVSWDATWSAMHKLMTSRLETEAEEDSFEVDSPMHSELSAAVGG